MRGGTRRGKGREEGGRETRESLGEEGGRSGRKKQERREGVDEEEGEGGG